jgi:arylsulfatase A-like enzyme
VPRVPHPRFKGSSGHGLRGDCIQEFDWCVGEIMKSLDDAKVANNTLIIVTSDNGGVMDDGYVDGTGNDLSGHKCNGNLRGFKGGLFEGGHRVPMVARWPGKTPAGKTTAELISHVDTFATVAAIIDKPLDTAAAPDSFNQLATFFSDKPAFSARDHLVHQSNGIINQALRKGNFKYIPLPKNAKKGEEQLFDLEKDPTETTNLAKANPDKVKELSNQLAELVKSQKTRK